MGTQVRGDLAGHLRHAVPLDEGENPRLEWGHTGVKTHDNALLALHFFLVVGVYQTDHAGAARPHGRLHDAGKDLFTASVVEVLQRLPGELFVLREIVVAAIVHTFDLPPSEGKLVFDIDRGPGVVGELLVFAPSELARRDADGGKPLPALLFPVFVPLFLGTGSDEVLHFHLFELARSEEKISGVDFVSKGLADLGDAEREFVSHCRLDIQEVDVRPLGGLRPHEHSRAILFDGTDVGLEHEVESARLGEHALIATRRALSGAALLVAEQILAETGLAAAAIHQRIGEVVDVSGGLPDTRVHQDAGVEALNVLAIGHSTPPGLLDIAQQLDPERPVIPAAIEAAVDL